jgi:DNA-binding transcriptional ArsR family regulator
MNSGLLRTPLRPPVEPAAGVTAKFFRVLGDPTRLRVLQLLEMGERNVSDLAAGTGALQGRLSSHLACLRWCGLVKARRQGRQVYYSLRDRRVEEILRLAEGFLEENAGSVEMCQIIDAGPAGRRRKALEKGDPR